MELNQRLSCHDDLKRHEENNMTVGGAVKGLKKSLKRTFSTIDHEDAYGFTDDNAEKMATRTVNLDFKDNPFQSLEESFKFFDEDNSGHISKTEFREAMSRLDHEYDPSEFSQLLANIDLDGDGMINFEEFKKIMAHKFKQEEVKEKEDIMSLSAEELLCRSQSMILVAKEGGRSKCLRLTDTGYGEGQETTGRLEGEESERVRQPGDLRSSLSTTPIHRLSRAAAGNQPQSPVESQPKPIVQQTVSLGVAELDYMMQQEKNVGLHRIEDQEGFFSKEAAEVCVGKSKPTGEMGEEEFKTFLVSEEKAINKRNVMRGKRKLRKDSSMTGSPRDTHYREPSASMRLVGLEDPGAPLEASWGGLTPGTSSVLTEWKYTPEEGQEGAGIKKQIFNRKGEQIIPGSVSKGGIRSSEDGKPGELDIGWQTYYGLNAMSKSVAKLCDIEAGKSPYMLEESSFWISNRISLLAQEQDRGLRKVKHWELKILVETQELLLAKFFMVPKLMLKLGWCCFLFWVIGMISVLFMWGVNMDSDAADKPVDELVEAATSSCPTRETYATGEALVVDVSADDSLNLVGAQNTADENNANFTRYRNVLPFEIPDVFNFMIPEESQESIRFLISSLSSWALGTVILPVPHKIFAAFLLAILCRNENKRLRKLSEHKSSYRHTDIMDYSDHDQMLFICCWPDILIKVLAEETKEADLIKLKLDTRSPMDKALEFIVKKI